jgi:hypothetical protein
METGRVISSWGALTFFFDSEQEKKEMMCNHDIPKWFRMNEKGNPKKKEEEKKE